MNKGKKLRTTYDKFLGSSHWGNVVSVGIIFGICNLKKGWKEEEEDNGT